ncbi:M48 family metallopeptidase [Candidatus Latescibacterota bacterium]
MNIYFVIILTALLLDTAVTLLADILNLHALNTDLPVEFHGVFDDEKIASSRSYTRATTMVGIIRLLYLLSLTLAFWFLGGFNTLDRVVLSITAQPVLSGIVYITLLLIAKTVLTLPFSIYSTFVVEERFGLNKTTKSTYLLDLLKSITLAALIGGPLLAGVLAFFEYTGPYAWLYCWGFISLFLIAVQFVAPAWIMPLFYTFTPIGDGDLRDRITGYLESVSFPMTGIYVIDGSRRSTKSNAFFTGFGRNRRVALFDTLIGDNTAEEIVAILAHEIGHYKKHHILKGIAIGIAHMGLLLFLLSLFLGNEGLFDAFFMDRMSVFAGFVFFGLLYTPVDMVLSVLFNILLRSNEFEADRYAVVTTGDREPFIAALKKLAVNNLANVNPHPFYVFLHYSHPPLVERITALRGDCS